MFVCVFVYFVALDCLLLLSNHEPVTTYFFFFLPFYCNGRAPGGDATGLVAPIYNCIHTC